ncbi:MAG: glycosyltransferase [bacterium]
MRISVVVLTQNRLRSLQRCIARLDASAVRDWELVVVDNGSTDGTRAFLEEEKSARGKRFCVIENDKGGSFAEARNLGSRAASGDWIAFTDDDCAVSADWLKRIQTAARAGLDAVGGLVLPMRPLHYPKWWDADLGWVVGLSVPGHFSKDAGRIYYPAASNMAARREALLPEGFQEIGGDFGEQTNRYLAGREDAELWQRLRVRGFRTRFDPKMVVFHDIPQDRLRWMYLARRGFQDGRTFFRRQRKKEFARHALRDLFAAPIELTRVAIKRPHEFSRAVARQSVWLARQTGFLTGWLSDGTGWRKWWDFCALASTVGAQFVADQIKPVVRRRLLAARRRKERSELPKQPKHVLVVVCGFVGDLVLVKSLLDFLKRPRPGMKITQLSY